MEIGTATIGTATVMLATETVIILILKIVVGASEWSWSTGNGGALETGGVGMELEHRIKTGTVRVPVTALRLTEDIGRFGIGTGIAIITSVCSNISH